MKIILSTTFTPYSTDTVIKPTSMLWFLRNGGKYNVIVNNAYNLGYNGSFGIDNSQFLIPKITQTLKQKKNYQVKDDTVYNVRFGSIMGYVAFQLSIPDKQVVLVQTFVKLQK